MFLREKEDGRIELNCSLAQAKQLYLGLFHRLHAGGIEAFDLLDEDDMLLTLQGFLQRKARQAGVDATDHAQWDAFLGVRDAPSCEQRFSARPGPAA